MASDLFNLITDTFPANNDVAVPLRSVITITLAGLDYDTDNLKEGLFVEGPDTDQFIGPGLGQLSVPQNISQGDENDFLRSPGYTGIVDGDVTVSGIAGNTVVSFTSTLPLAPLNDYVVNLTGVTTSGLLDIDGFVTLGFQTGSGSIETVPESVSSSVLSSGAVETFEPGVLSANGVPLVVSFTSPTDDAVEVALNLDEIVITFNQDIDPTTIANDLITVKAVAATDHPNVTVTTVEELAKTVTVDKNQLKIKI